MKLNEIKAPTELDKALEFIKRDCQPFLKKCGGKAMFRGMKKQGEYLKLAVRADRKPSSTPLFVHNVMDNWFNKKFGFKARSNAMFATGDFRIASHYGGNLQKVFAIFPIGDFEYVWSKNVGDLYLEVEEVLFDERTEERRPDNDNLVAAIEYFLDYKRYQTTELALAIGSKNEVMISCQHYYAILVETKAAGNALVKKLTK